MAAVAGQSSSRSFCSTTKPVETVNKKAIYLFFSREKMTESGKRQQQHVNSILKSTSPSAKNERRS
jgi:hypothetical protein